jgi:hypothetical protein
MSEEKFLKLKIVLDRFVNILHELYGFYLDAEQGFEFVSKQAQQSLHLPGRIIANGPPDDPNAVILNSSTWDEIRLRNQKSGSNTEKAKRYVLVMILEHWNSDIRSEIAKALGFGDANDVKSEIMGDLNKIRIDLLHVLGKTKQSASNIIIKFQKGSSIVLTTELFDKIFVEIFEYFNKLAFEQTGRIMYLDRSLHPKAKETHRSMKHIVEPLPIGNLWQ